jgi:ribonucleoside-triphosphate reductase
LNLPRLAFLAKTKEKFFELLSEWMDDARDSLIVKRKILEHYTTLGLYPYSKYYLQPIFEQTKTYWGNHFSTIGLVGMNECLINLTGKGIVSPEGKELAEQILDFMRNKISDFQAETGSLFNLEATPAEGVSYRLPRLDKAEFPEIKVANEAFWARDHSVAPYYTNSSHIPVNFTHDIFEVLNHQDSLQTKYTGGTVLHIFVGEKKPSPEGIKELVRTIAHSYRLPYFTLTPTFSICPSHGYLSGEHQTCPDCKAPCEVYSRIVGYFRPIQNWNAGKRSEFSDRLLYELTKVRWL